MDLQAPLLRREQVEQFLRQHRIGLLTMLFTDIVGSTRLKQDMGDETAFLVLQQHHDLVRQTLRPFSEAEEISTAGDSFFIVFAKPSDAVKFALVLQARLRESSAQTGHRIEDRIGIHIGEVVIEERTDLPKAKDLYGLQVDICARVMGLAEGKQVLLSRSAFDSARQVLKGVDLVGLQGLAWLNHGPYLLKGVEEPLEICEVGEVGEARLKAPGDSDKAHRQVSVDQEPVLGWRPAVGQRVPNTEWVLEERLGEGGFGEVWVGCHERLKERRVFKFCFRADRVRSLKRELTLFRLMKERLGEHPHIVSVFDVYLEQPPYYLMIEYVAGRDLRQWCEQQGGAGQISLSVKLELMAQTADALQAAHEAGVIHRDVKPTNILVAEAGPRKSGPVCKLTDFGIGQVVSAEALAGMTKAGFTQTIVTAGSPGTGSHLYMAPELLAGKPASTRSDIYSLGVVLYQFLVGDFTRPVTTDWAKDIADALLREDLARCFAGNPQERFAGAGQLAERLRSWEQRKAALAEQQAVLAARERAAYRRGIMRTAAVAAVLVAAFTLLSIIAFNQSRKESQQRQRAERNLYAADMYLARQAWEDNNIFQLQRWLVEAREFPDRGFEWYYWQRQIHLELKTLRGHTEGITSVAFSPDGRRIATGSWDNTAKLWDAESGRELLTLKGHTNRLYSVAFSPDGRRIVTGSYDRTAKVWNTENGRELLTLKGHTSAINSVAFAPDGRRIVTGSEDQTAKVWDVESGRELLTLKGHTHRIWSVAFSPDGRRIVTGSLDGTAKVWIAASPDQVAAWMAQEQTK